MALTGVHGTPGAALVRRLEEDDRVSRLVLLDRRAPALPLRKGTARVVDLTAALADGAVADVLARERVETVIHAAFHAAPVRNFEAAHEIEVIGTRAVLHAVADNVRHAGTVTNVVVLGSTMSYGAFPENAQYLGEDAPLRGGPGYPFVADRVAAEFGFFVREPSAEDVPPAEGSRLGVVGAVLERSAAARGGLAVGDRVLAVNGEATESADAVRRQLRGVRLREALRLRIERRGEPQDLTLPAVERPLPSN